MSDKIFILGGCRSGKSSYALKQALELSSDKKFIATCIALDEEMEIRVKDHQKQRGMDWITLETPLYVPQRVLEHDGSNTLFLIDCLTMWVNNMQMEDWEEEKIFQQIELLQKALGQIQADIILVSNEVGTGIVPESKLVRQFRDYVGAVNQKVASCVDKVFWMVAGIPMSIK